MTIDTSKLDQETKRKYWNEVIENFNQSGLKLKEYCTLNNLKYDHLAYYLQQYRKNSQNNSELNNNFIPVQIDTNSFSQYTICVDSNIEIKLPASHNVTQIVALVSELRKALC